MIVSSMTEKPDALKALAAAAGLGAVDPWADTAGRIAAAIAEILPAETNRGVALRPAATLRADVRRLVFPGRARDLRPPAHYDKVPPGFTHASREALTSPWASSSRWYDSNPLPLRSLKSRASVISTPMFEI